MDKLKAFLQSIAPISDKEFEDSKRHFYTTNLKKGEVFLELGKVCKQMSFVNRGSLRTFYINEKAEEITHCFRTENSLVSSYRSFILQEPSELSIIAMEETELIVIDNENLQRLYKSSLIWQTIGRLFAEKSYVEMEAYASFLNNESAKEKYSRLIKEQGEVLQLAKLEQIASYLGVTRRTLTRIRQEISIP